MNWTARHPAFEPEMLGYLDSFLHEENPRSAQEQFNAVYHFGTGWSVGKWTMLPDDSLFWPGDQPLPAIAETRLRHERILLYPGAWVAIVQPDGVFAVQRMD